MTNQSKTPFDDSRHVAKSPERAIIFYILAAIGATCIAIPLIFLIFMIVTGYNIPQILTLWGV